MGFLKRFQERWATWHHHRLFPESRVVVHVEDGVVRCTRPGKEPEAIALSRLTRVAIETTDAGPYACDVFWILEDAAGTRLVVPKGATGEDALVDYLLNLDGFDPMSMLLAMSSTTNNLFECWTA